MVGRSRTPPTLRLVVGDGERDGGGSREKPPTPRTSALDDAELLAACRRGDASAARALHTRVRGIVDATVARLLGRKDARFEDLAQIALGEIARSLARFRGECSLDTWSSRVTANAVYKELRRRRIERRVFVDDAVDDDVPSSHDTLRTIEARNALRRIRAHLAEMDPIKAWIVVLHDVGGYDLKEIAEITGTTVTAAQSRLVRGRADLHARIDGDPELRDMLTEEGRRR